MKGSSLTAIAQVLGLSSNNGALVSGFAFDSRKSKRGDLFFALSGAKVDGHQFLEQVAAQGALGAVVSNQYRGKDFSLELLRVEDVKAALHALAAYSFSKRSAQVVAITGSMGKTTTKEFLATLLSAKYRVAKTPGNANTQVSFPLTLLNLEGEFDVLVLEMGMNQKGEIKKLVSIAPPDLAIVTRIAPAGMEDFKGGLQAIAEAKAEIFSHSRTRLGIVGAQAAEFDSIFYAGNIPKRIYGLKEEIRDPRKLDFFLDGDIIYEPDLSCSPPIHLSFSASHLKENFVAAALVARLLGLSWQEIVEKASELQPFERRFQKIERDGITFIQDCYNANPDSVRAALKNLPQPKTGGKAIGVLGSMLDLGAYSTHFHKEIGEFARDHLDQVICIGNEAKSLGDAFGNASHFSDLLAVKKALFSLAKPGDVVLIKGANTLKLWELLDDASTPD